MPTAARRPPPLFVPGSGLMARAVEAERCRRSLWHFTRGAWDTLEPGTKFVDNWHIGATCEFLEAVTRREIKRGIITIPPGHMKSLEASVFWPAWEWVDRPSEQGLYGSYDEGLVLRDANRTRDLIKSDWYQNTFNPTWHIKRNQDAANYFVNTLYGNRKVFTMGGKHKTGWRGNKVVLDDAIGADQRFDKAAKDFAYETYTKVLSSRVNDPATAAFLVMGQRLAEDDLPGRLMQLGGYEVLRLPTEFNRKKRCVYIRKVFDPADPKKPKEVACEPDPRKEDGELLFSQKYTREVVEDLRKTMLPDEFEGQYNQEPVSASGSRFNKDWFRYWSFATDQSHQLSPLVYLHTPGGDEMVRLDKCWTFVSVDLACSERRQADYTVMLLWAVTPAGHMILLDRWKERADEPKVVAAARRIYSRRNAAHAPHSFFAVESNGLGKPIAQAMAQGDPRNGLPALPVVEVYVHADKMVMSTTAAVRLHAGQIYFPQPDVAPWITDFEYYVTRFPLADHDDDVSALSIGATAVYDGAGGVILSSQAVPVRNPGEKPVDRLQPRESRAAATRGRFGM